MNREKHFMIDIESTGVDFVKDEVLEIGVVELDWVDGYWEPGRTYHTFVWSARQPESEFAKTHMAEVYRQSNAAPKLSYAQVRQSMVDWFATCGKTGQEVLFVGWNAANFDVSMLNAKGLLQRPGYVTIDGKDKAVGDHHYRVYEMCGAIQLASDVLNKPYSELKETIKTVKALPLPAGKQHDALYDCYVQTNMLNGLIHMLRDGGGSRG